MSIRAYRVNKIEYKEAPSFNIGNYELINFFEASETEEHYINNEGAIIEVHTELLKKALKEMELEQPEITALREDIDYAISKGDETVTYHLW